MTVVDFDVTIEIPKGSRNKYEVDHHTGRIRLDRTLFTATQYPADYGFIDEHPRPGRRSAGRAGAAGRADVPRLPGHRPGHRHVPDDGRGRPGRQGAVRRRPTTRGRRTCRTSAICAIFEKLEIQHFFEVYKDLEPGKSVEGANWVGRGDAETEIRISFDREQQAAGRRGAWPRRGGRRGRGGPRDRRGGGGVHLQRLTRCPGSGIRIGHQRLPFCTSRSRGRTSSR